MTDDEIRAIVRQVLAARAQTSAPVPSALRPHASQLRLTMVTVTEPGSPCVIEPTVGCNQCGYCVSLGH